MNNNTNKTNLDTKYNNLNLEVNKQYVEEELSKYIKAGATVDFEAVDDIKWTNLLDLCSKLRVDVNKVFTNTLPLSDDFFSTFRDFDLSIATLSLMLETGKTFNELNLPSLVFDAIQFQLTSSFDNLKSDKDDTIAMDLAFDIMNIIHQKRLTITK